MRENELNRAHSPVAFKSIGTMETIYKQTLINIRIMIIL